MGHSNPGDAGTSRGGGEGGRGSEKKWGRNPVATRSMNTVAVVGCVGWCVDSKNKKMGKGKENGKEALATKAIVCSRESCYNVADKSVLYPILPILAYWIVS